MESKKMNNSELPYVTRDREAGNIIERFATKEEAEQALAAYEEADRKDGIFVEDFYEVAKEESAEQTSSAPSADSAYLG